eukprot:2182288-Lingulodinium_polyedra.AAC.1
MSSALWPAVERSCKKCPMPAAHTPGAQPLPQLHKACYESQVAAIGHRHVEACMHVPDNCKARGC